MQTLRVKAGQEEEAATVAAEVLRAGGVVLFPAERLYGLAADATQRKAVKKVCALKGRPADQPLPVIVADEEMAREWVKIPPLAERLIKTFWPGPLTLVLPRRRDLPEEVTAKQDDLGLRAPGNLLARLLSQKLQLPLTATSANPSGEPETRDAQAAVRSLFGKVELVLDVGLLPGPPGSTVLKVREKEWRVIRAGIISEVEIRKVLEKKT